MSLIQCGEHFINAETLHMVDVHICVTETYVILEGHQIYLPAYIIGGMSSDGENPTVTYTVYVTCT